MWQDNLRRLLKKSGWATAIENYKKVKSLPKEKTTGNTYSELRTHYALFNDINESLNLELSEKP